MILVVITSEHLVTADLSDWLSPVAEGAELWAAEGGAVLRVPQRKNVLHQLTQSAVALITVKGEREGGL